MSKTAINRYKKRISKTFKKVKKKILENRKLSIIIGSVLGVILLSVIVLLVFKTWPNDNIFVLGSNSPALYANKNPKFEVNFGKKEQPEDQWVRFESKPSAENPFESEKPNFFQKIFHTIKPKESLGVEMSLVGMDVNETNIENLGDIEDEVKSVAEILGTEEIETSTSLIEMGREIGVYDDEQIISKETIVNESVGEGIDLEYQILAGVGVKEEIVIQSLEAFGEGCLEDSSKCKLPLNEYTFDLKLDEGVNLKSGLYTVKGKTTEAYYFENDSGEYLSHFLPSFAIDGIGMKTYDVDFKIEEVDEQSYKIVVTVDLEWLLSDERTFPIRIDPSIVHDDEADFSGGYYSNTEYDTSEILLTKDPYEVTDDTVVLFHMDETGDNSCSGGEDACDSSSNGFHATASGSPDIVTGILGNAREFDGSTDYLSIANQAALNPTDEFTLSAWVNRDVEDVQHSVIEKYNWVSGQGIYVIRITSGNIIEVSTVNGTLSNYCRGATELNANTWYHIAGTFNTNTNSIKCYVNGRLDGINSSATLNPISSSNPIRIGARGNDLATKFDGKIDEIEIANKEYSSTEIKAMYEKAFYNHAGVYGSSTIDTGGNQGINSFSWIDSGSNTESGETPYSTTGLVAQWNLNEASGTTALSGGSCGTLCNGTVTNAVTTGQDDSTTSGWTYDDRKWGDGAIKLDGSNDYVNVVSVPITTGDTAHTISAWIKPDGTPSIREWPLQMGTAGNGSHHWTYNTDGKIYAGVWAGSQCFVTPDIGKWNYIVASYDGSGTLKCYKNGVEESSIDSATFNLQGVKFQLGIDQTGGSEEYFDGTMDNVSLYSRALTESEIQSNYQSGNIEFEYRYSDDGTTWSDWEGGSKKEIDVIQQEYYEEIPNKLVRMDFEDDGQATMTDKEGNYNGTLGGNATRSSTSKIGDSSIYFDGTDDYLTLGDVSEMDAPDMFTVGMWFNRTTDNSGTANDTNHLINNTLLAQSSNSANDNLEIGTEGSKLEIYLDTGGTDIDGVDGGMIEVGLANNEWHHLAVSFDYRSGTEIKIFFDGDLVYESSNPNNALTSSDTSPLSLGLAVPADLKYGDYNGYIDDFFISMDALTANDIKKIYNYNTDYSNENKLDDTGLVLHYTLDETTGDLAGEDFIDKSGYGNHGEIEGTNLANRSVEGIREKARDFNGTDDYINSSINSIPVGSSGEDLSVSFWMNLDSVSGQQGIVSLGGSSSDQFDWMVSNESGKIWFRTDGGNNNGTSATISSNTWYHIVATWGVGTGHVVYVNGVPSSLYTNTDTSSARDINFFVGVGFNSGSFWNTPIDGSLDDVRVYDRMLSEAEIKELSKYQSLYYDIQELETLSAKGYSNIEYNIASNVKGSHGSLITEESKFANYLPDKDTIGLWHMEEQFEDSCIDGDDICNAASSSYNGVNTSVPTRTEAEIGLGRYFDGNDDYITLDSGFADFTDGLTISFWANPTASNNYARFIDFGAASGAGNANIIVYRSGTTSTMNFYTGNGTSIKALSVANAIINNEWHYYTMTLDSSGIGKMYRDGVEIGSDSSMYIPANSTRTNCYIGQSNWTADGLYEGYMDEVRVDNTVRSQKDIELAFQHSARGFGIEIEFKADLQNSNLITNSNDTTFTISETEYGTTEEIENLSITDTIIIRELVDGVQYLAQGDVATTNTATGAITVTSWKDGSTFPSGGFTTYAEVFKWEKKIFSLTDRFDNEINEISSLAHVRENTSSLIWIDSVSLSKYISEDITNTDEQLSNLDTGSSSILHKEGTAAEELGMFSTNINFTSKDLSGYTKIPFWIASDELGSNVVATYGESKYANYESDANTVVFWNMEEGVENSCYGGGDICDSSSNGLNGSFVETTAFTTDTVRDDYAVVFDGNSDYISVPSSQALNDVANTGSSATYEAWINIGVSNNAQSIFSKMHTVNNQALYDLEVYEGKIQFLITSGSTDKYISEKSVIRPGEWHHIVVTHTYGTGSSTKMYLDGRLIDGSWNSGGNGSLDSSNTNPLLIGHAEHTSYPAWLNGKIDDIRISNIARSATDIQQAYEVGRRSHEVTVDFKADLQSSNLISSSSDQSFTISETPYSADLAIENIKVGETIIVKEGSSDTYQYSMPLTVDNTQVSGSAPLSDFPAFVDIQSDNLKTEANGGHVTQATGDFNFTNSAGDTGYSFEIESYDGTTGSLKAWVRIPSLSNSSDTSFKIQYGHGSYLDQEDAEGVWDANYSAVWHMSESSGTVYDSTSNNNDLVTVNGSPDYSQDGKTGSAINFDGSSEYFRTSGGVTTNFPTGSSSYTTQVWYRPDDAGSADGWIIWGPTGTGGWTNGFRRNGSTQYINYWWGNDLVATASGISNGNWYMGAATYNGTTRRVFHNGSQAGSHNPSAPNVQSGSLYVGKTYGGEYWDGRIDEIRVSKTDRGGDWLATEYNNQNSPSTFMTLGSETQEITDIYYAQGTVDSINTSTGAITVSSWDDGSTFPTGGYTTSASIFKWQREFIDLRLTSDKDGNTDAVTDITFRRLGGTDANIYIDDIRAGEDLAYIGTPQYFQYRSIFTTTDTNLTPTLSSVTVDYLAPTVTGPTNAQLMRHGMWFSGTGEKQCFWWAGECGGSSAVCGNSSCEAGENASTCPGDCPASCGDGFCTHDENSVTCNADCAGSPTTYEYNMALTVDNTKVSGTSDLSNFPVLVDIQSDNLKTFSNGGHVAQSTGDFKFTNTAGDTDYDFELESYNETTGSVRAWVRIPTLQATSDTSFKIWYGNAQYVNQENAEGVWNTDYSAVWHMDEGSGTVYDSTSNNNDLTTTNGAPIFSQTGRVGDAISFDGIDDNLFGSTVAGLGTTNLTISAWAYLDSTSESGAFIKIGKEVGTGTDNNGYGLGVGGSNFNNDGNDIIGLYEGVIWRDTGVTIGTGWHNVTLTVDGSSVPRYYLDGSLVSTGSGTPYTPTLGGVKIGGYTASNNDNRFVDSVLDEIRVSTALRNVDWLTTEYNNINSPSTFISVGAEQ